MAIDKINSARNKDKKEFIFWLIRRYDDHRSSLSSRGAILLSGATILLGSNIFLLDKTLAHSFFTSVEKCILCFLIIVTFAFLTTAIYCATLVTCNVWKLADEMFGTGIRRGFFHAGTISKTYKDAKDFFNAFHEQEPEELLSAGIVEIWVSAMQHDHRYRFMRWASIFLILSMIPIILSIVTFLTFFLP
jgi:hypothetical protein